VTSLEGVVSAQTRRRALIGACVAWLLAMVIVTVAACISGCGTSDLQVHAAAADAVGVAVTASGGELLSARQRDLDAAHADTAYREDAQAAVAAVRLRYEPALATFEALRLTHGAWVDVLVLAAAGDLDDVPRWLVLARRVVSAWGAWSAVGRALGLDVPAPPPMLASFAGAP